MTYVIFHNFPGLENGLNQFHDTLVKKVYFSATTLL